MIDFTPALRSFWMTSGADAVICADCDGLAAIVCTSGVIPALRRSGSRYVFSASWSLARSPTMIPELVAAADEPGRLTPLDERREQRRLVDAQPPQVGRTHLRVVGHRRPLREQRRLPLLGDAELVVARPAADAVDDRERRRAALGPVLAERPLARGVERVVVGDDRVDLPAVDPALVVDLVDEELDRLRLLGELDVAREAELRRQSGQVHHGEHDVDALCGHAARARARLVDRRARLGRVGGRGAR